MWVTFAASAVVTASLWTDWRSREIPHWLVGSLTALWVVAAVAVPQAIGGTPLSGLLGAALLFVLGLILHAAGWLGAGDGKLLAVVALWLGPRDLPFALFGTALIGVGLLVIALLRPQGDFRERGIPFAWAIAPPAATMLLARALGP